LFIFVFIIMKKTIRLTESDLTRLVKRIIKEQSTTFTPEMLNSPKGQITKQFKQVFNKLYKTNFPLDGNWKVKGYNETMSRYIKDKGLSVYVCKKGDGYCGDDQEGEVTVNGNDNTKNLFDLMRADLSGGNKPQGEKVNTTNDRTYDYKFSNGKYYYSTKGQNKWVEAKGKGLESIKTKVKF